MSSKKKAANKQQKQAKDRKEAKAPEFPCKTVLFLTLSILAILIYSDVQANGSWKESKTAFYLKEYRVCEYSHKVLNKTSEGIKWMNTEIDKQFPGYEQKLHEVLEPYGDVLSNLAIISVRIANNANEAIIEVFKLVAEKVEKHAPGILEQGGEYVKTVGTATSLYTKRTYDYFKNEFFTGKLAPEHIREVVMDALGTAQQKLSDFYVWADEKIRTAIK